MLDIDVPNERILKEYIDGPTIYELVKNDAMQEMYLKQVEEMAQAVYSAGLKSLLDTGNLCTVTIGIVESHNKLSALLT